MASLSRGQPEDAEIFSEYLDLSRFPAAQYGDDLVRYLRARYAARKPDVVIPVGVCVAGTGTQEQRWNNEARKVLERFATRVHTRWLDKWPLEAVLDEVAELPPDSVVLYIPMLRDGAGESVSPYEVAWASASWNSSPPGPGVAASGWWLAASKDD